MVPPSDLGAVIAQVRKPPKRKRMVRKLRHLDIPMAPTINVQRGTPSGAYAESDGTTIYADGRLDDMTMAHESAHLLDAQVMTDADRLRFATIMGHPNRPWEKWKPGPEDTEVSSRDSLGEQFAEMVSMLATKDYPRPGHMSSGYTDNPPSLRELLRFGHALERLGRRNDLQRYRRPG